MRKRYCPECGGEIILTREVPSRSWSIEENELEKADNNISNDPELIFHCENDREHDVGDCPAFDQWCDEVIEFYNKRVLPFLY